MDTADVLRRKRAKLADQLAFIDELLAEMTGVEDAVGDGGANVSPQVARPVKVIERRPAAPKAARPAPAPRPAGEPGPAASGYAERVAAALLGGPLNTTAICAKAGISAPTVAKALKGRPEWFLRTGAGVATKWELTNEGRQAVQSAREG